MNYFNDVGFFHHRMGLPISAELGILRSTTRGPNIPQGQEWDFRLAFLVEEITELLKAQAKGDLPGFADALVDIVYVVLGTAHYAGIPFDALWREVQRANMEKRPWQEGDPVKPRNTIGLEVVKPEGWVPPRILGILAGFRVKWGFSSENFCHNDGTFGGELDEYSPGTQCRNPTNPDCRDPDCYVHGIGSESK